MGAENKGRNHRGLESWQPTTPAHPWEFRRDKRIKRLKRMAWIRNYKPMHKNSLCQICRSNGANRLMPYGDPKFMRPLGRICWSNDCLEALNALGGI